MNALDTEMLLLIMETLLYLAWAGFLVWLPFASIAPSLGSWVKETPHLSNYQETILIKLSVALHMMSQHTLWDSNCLVRAITAMMLDRRHIAHDWLRSVTFYATGAEEMRKFTVVGTFSKRLDNPGHEGSYDE
jgi:hypothetical protein